MTKILITGSRGIKSKIIVDYILNKEIKEWDYVIQGGADGVDNLVVKWCNKTKKNINYNTLRPINFKREYFLHRNAEMIGMCDRVIAIWDGKSRGTKFTIDYAKARNIPVMIFNEKGELAQ